MDNKQICKNKKIMAIITSTGSIAMVQILHTNTWFNLVGVSNNKLFESLFSIALIGVLVALYIFRTNKYLKTLKEKKEVEQNLIKQLNEIEVVQEELNEKENEIKRQYEELELKKEELRISRERYRLTVNATEVGIWEWEYEQNFIFVAYKATTMLNLQDVNYITPKDFLKKVFRADRHQLLKQYNEHLNNKSSVFQIECRILTDEGKYSWINISGKVLFDMSNKPLRMAGSVNNINKEKITEAKLKKLAYYDELTGLPNRTYFVAKLTEILESNSIESKKTIVLLIDLDNFKSINDALGHVYGDQVLQYVAKRLQGCIGANDCLSRFGGDEFIIYTNSLGTKKDIEKYVNDIIMSFRDTYDVVGISFTITVSIGITVAPDDGLDVNNIMKYADMAMNHAKYNGKNTFAFYTEELNKKIMRRIQIENDLRQAIEKNEFMLVYQPKVCINDNTITGLEALIRWKHPEKGMISPAEFIPIAEESGYIIQIG